MEAVLAVETTERLNHHPTFSQWLYWQQSTDGVLGRVARWIYNDLHSIGKSCWPHRAKTISHMSAHLRVYHRHDRNAPTEMQIRETHRAYRTFRQEGGAIPVRRGGLPAREGNPTMHRGYLLPITTINKIRELARMHTATEGHLVSQGKVIERLVNVAYRHRFRKRTQKSSA